MLRNYLKIALRNIVRHKAFSLINLSGLAIGMAASVLIFLWVQNELSYDRFHRNAGEVYRITANASGFQAAVNPAGMPAGLQSRLPLIKKTVRLSHLSSALLQTGDRKFQEKRVFYVDSTFFDVFSFPLVRGDAATALARPDAVLITEDLAKKYFGTVDALGKTMKKDNQSFVTVTGVLANIPGNSHLQFDCLFTIASIAADSYDLKSNVWDNFNFYTYIQLEKSFQPTPAALTAFGRQMDAIYKEHVPEFKVTFQLQPLTRIHLDPPMQVDLPGHGNVQYVNVFFVVAIFILVVACINFMNLATARSERRAREVGLRKVVGALRGQLIGQFLGESILLSLLALVLAIGLVWLALPLFNHLADKSLSLDLLNAKNLAGLIGISLATGLVAGSYPALYLSGFRPVRVLKGTLRITGGNLSFRNTLVVTQFVIAIVLLAGTIVIYRQLTFIRDRNPGFEKENLLYMPMSGTMWDRKEEMKNELGKDPLTSAYTIVSELPTNLIAGTINVDWEGKDPNSQVIIPSLNIDENFIDVFHIRLLKGRAFSLVFRADSSNYIVNERALKVMGMTLDNAVGKPLTFGGHKGMIIGVVKDFNFKPVQQAIEPLVLLKGNWNSYVMVRARPGRIEATLHAMERISHQVNPDYPFQYNFLDQDLANLYKGEQQMGSIFNFFAILAIFISCLGLYGLSAFMAQQRTREIGVRKVLGASGWGIVYLLSTSFTRLVLIAIVIAIPLSWWAIHQWLAGFAFHIEVGWIIFVLAAISALLIAWLTVSYESLRAAFANPVKSLRSE